MLAPCDIMSSEPLNGLKNSYKMYFKSTETIVTFAKQFGDTKTIMKYILFILLIFPVLLQPITTRTNLSSIILLFISLLKSSPSLFNHSHYSSVHPSFYSISSIHLNSVYMYKSEHFRRIRLI